MKKTFFAFFVFFLLLAFVFSACKKNSPSSPVPADTLPPTTLTVTPTASPVLSATETLTVTVTLTVTETATATVTPTATLIVGSYIMNLHALDEDHALFGAMPGFMNSSDWSILAKVKIPSYAQYYPTADGGYGCGDGGLVISRSRGWYDQNGDIDISLGTQGFGFRLYYGGWVSGGYTGTFNKEQWYSVAVLYTAADSSLRFYVDANLVYTYVGGPWNDNGNTNPHTLGGQYNPGGYGRGMLVGEADIAIANEIWLKRAVTITELQQYMNDINSISKSDPACVLWLTVGNGTLTDETGNHTSITLVNNPEFSQDPDAFAVPTATPVP